MFEEKSVRAFIENTDLKKLTQQQKEQFIAVAKAYNLDPIKREIYCNTNKKKGNYEDTGYEITIVIGYESFLKRAETLGVLDGWEVSVKGKISIVTKKVKEWDKARNKYKDDLVDKDVWRSDKENPLSAIIKIYRKDRGHPFVWEVPFDEYVQDNPMWFGKPLTMIKKVSIAQGFRLFFPNELGGMPYIEEELRNEDDNHFEQENKKENPYMPKQTEPENRQESKESEAVHGTETINNTEIIVKKKALNRLFKQHNIDVEKFMKSLSEQFGKQVSEFTVDDWATAINEVNRYVEESK